MLKRVMISSCPVCCMKSWLWNVLLLLVLFASSSCEKDISVDIPDPEDKLVVEGWIEQDRPPFVILTQNAAFFGQTDVNQLDSFFVHNATVDVSNGTTSDTLKELCLDDLPDGAAQEDFTQSFGVPAGGDGEPPNICVYTVEDIAQFFFDPSSYSSFKGEPGTNYELTVKARGQTLKANDRIRELMPIDSLSYRFKDNSDTLISVIVNLREPEASGNFIRYFTKRNSEPFYAPQGGSVYDDNFFSGRYFSLPVERGISNSADVDFEEFGYFYRGDTVILRWTHITKEHYDFWSTLEYEQGNSANPFSSPTRINSNVEGGLGVWGGYAADYDTIILPQ